LLSERFSYKRIRYLCFTRLRKADMEAHYNYLAPLISEPNTQKFVTAIIVALVLALVGRIAASRISSSEGRARAIIPSKRFSLTGFFDFFVEAFVNFQDSILGKENRKFLPLTGTIFLFLLSANLLGVVPGMPALTTSVWINVGMALVVFIYFNYLGIKYNGLSGYLTHFFGTLHSPLITSIKNFESRSAFASFFRVVNQVPLFLVGLFLFLLELCFTLPLRMLTLNMRLYWNISADHTVLALFTDLLPPGLPIVFYVLATFVCFMQAFIFTTLTMVYILLATQHEHEEEEASSAAKH